MLNIRISNQSIYLSQGTIAADAVQFVPFKVELSQEWDGFATTMRFRHGEDAEIYDVIDIVNGTEYFIPAEVLKIGRIFVSAVGVQGDSRIATSGQGVFIVIASGGIDEGVTPQVTPDAYAQYVEQVNIIKADTISARTDAVDAAQTATEQAEVATDKAAIAIEKSDQASASANAAKTSETNAKESEINAGESESVASQSLSDLLAMLGSDIATLTDGKLTPSQIPDLSINDVFPVANTDEMLTLDAQRGDCALVVYTNTAYDIANQLPFEHEIPNVTEMPNGDPIDHYVNACSYITVGDDLLLHGRSVVDTMTVYRMPYACKIDVIPNTVYKITGETVGDNYSIRIYDSEGVIRGFFSLEGDFDINVNIGDSDCAYFYVYSNTFGGENTGIKNLKIRAVTSIVTDSYILAADDPTILGNWKKLGVSYVANAGHASTAETAENANKINNHRLVTMTQAQYDVAAKDPGTVYLVGDFA